MLWIGSIVWGVQDLAKATAFWSAALNYKLLRKPALDEAILVPRDHDGPQLLLRHVTSPAARRHHMDLHTFAQATELERLISLGAQRVAWRYEPDADYVVLADPDGNRFCIVARPSV